MSSAALKTLYDRGFAAAARAEGSTSGADKSRALREAIGAFSQALALEPAGKNRALLESKLGEFEAAAAAVEEALLKLPGADGLVQRALALDNTKDASGAEALYLEAAQAYLSALKGRDVLPCQAARWRARADKVMTRVEEIKSRRPASPERRPLIAREQQGGEMGTAGGGGGEFYSAAEKEVLKDSSFVNGRLFVPWNAADAEHGDFVLERPFADPDGRLALSEAQRSALLGWRRFAEPLDASGSAPAGAARPCVVGAEGVAPENVVQDLVCDCSFVSSLVIAAYHEQRFKSRLISSIIFPQGKDGRPLYNPSGKYAVRLWWNGAPRRVVVDDSLPLGRDGRWLCSYSRRREELWVSLVEKAYMKLNGGFDFPGSVSGIDLYALTGWVPEVHPLQAAAGSGSGSGSSSGAGSGAADERDATWRKLLHASSHGDVLVTVATGALSAAASEALGLVPTHAYAVLCVCEVQGRRLVQLKNPWCKLSWRGRYSCWDERSWSAELCRVLRYDLQAARRSDSGLFWIDYDSLLESFAALYMNWNPALFRGRLVVHRAWPHGGDDDEGPRDDSFNVGSNPQFRLRFRVEGEEEGIVWLLLTRHVTRKQQLLSEDRGDFMTLSVYDKARGRRVYLPDQPMVRGVYTNNPHCLIPFQAARGAWDCTLVVSLFEKTRAVNYSLCVYASQHCAGLQLHDVPKHLAFCAPEQRGAWASSSSAGGCPRFPGFPTNPQWLLKAGRASSLHVRLLAPKEFPVNVRLYRAGAGRVDCADPRDEVASSGLYRNGLAVLQLQLPLPPEPEPGAEASGGAAAPATAPGARADDEPLTLVASTFAPDTHGPFLLHCEADQPVELIELPPDGAGMLRTERAGAWTAASGAGCPNFGRFHDNPRWALRVDQRTSLAARLTFLPPQAVLQALAQPTPTRAFTWPSLNLCLFSRGQLGPGTKLADALATANKGVYLNAPSGARIPPTLLEPGAYQLVPSTFQPMQGRYLLTLHTMHPVHVADADDAGAGARARPDDDTAASSPPPPPPPSSSSSSSSSPPPPPPPPGQQSGDSADYVAVAQGLLDELALDERAEGADSGARSRAVSL